MDVGRIRYSCKFPNCQNKYFWPIYKENYVNKHFFKFPVKNDALCQKWKNTCKIKSNVDCAKFYVCEDHFLLSDFYNSARLRLIYGSFPKLLTSSGQQSNIIHDHNYSSPQIDSINDSENIPDLLPIDSSSFKTLSDLTSPNTSDSSTLPHRIPTVTNCPKFNFLSDDSHGRQGIMGQSDITLKNLTDRELRMYQVHRNVCSKLSKLKSCLSNEKMKANILKELYDEGKFFSIEENLNEITRNFIESQLRNVGKTPSGKRWSTEDKVFALSMYKRSPRLYRYLHHFFELPSTRTLKRLLAKLPFNPGFNTKILEHLKLEINKMEENDKYCALLFDEVSLDSSLQYDPHRQCIVGYEDLGHLGRSVKQANHALVFMIRGVRKQWKQVIAYYFTASTISTDSLTVLIPYIISKLQEIGLNVIATVCDQGATNQSALKKLSSENKNNPSPYTFNVSGEEICIIFDVPHLLKLTRNALLRGVLEFEMGKYAKFEHIENTFRIDKQTRSFSQLPYLRNEHFNFKDSYMKMKVKIAARQLSHSVAASIETNVSVGKLEAEAIHTAEFAELIDKLFDLLNSNNQYPMMGKEYRCAFSAQSPHQNFLSETLSKLSNWKLYEPDPNDPKNPKRFKDITNKQQFINGWQITIRSIIHLWNRLKDKFIFLPLRSFNQDPLENTFGLVRQHGVCNTNPTCRQFTAALKTTVLNGLTVPISGSNVEADYCENLSNLSLLINTPCESESTNISSNKNLLNSNESDEENEQDFDFEKVDDNFGTAYTAGYLISKVVIPDCPNCKDKIFAPHIEHEHLFVQFKEYDGSTRLKYANKNLIEMSDKIFTIVKSFLETRGHELKLENQIISCYKSIFQSFIFCKDHVDVYNNLIKKCIRLCIFKYCKDKKKLPDFSKGHITKINRFKRQKLCHKTNVSTNLLTNREVIEETKIGKTILPNYKTLPNYETLPNSEAIPNCDTLPNYETLSNCETIPNCETLPNSETIPNCDALPDYETLSNCETVPNSETLPNCETLPKYLFSPNYDSISNNDLILNNEHNNTKNDIMAYMEEIPHDFDVIINSDMVPEDDILLSDCVFLPDGHTRASPISHPSEASNKRNQCFDPSEVDGLPSGSNHSEDLELWPWDEDSPPRIPFDPSEDGFLSFVPPPPRPFFLEDVTPDGVTTCDLCSWAWQGGNALTYEGRESAGELGWVLTLVIVSLSSALIGAVIMIIVLHCKSRLKNSSLSETERGISLHQQMSPRPPIHTPDDKEISTITPATFPNMPVAANVNGVWSWLARRSGTPPSNLNNPPSSHAENHYTHMEDQYNVEEALYAELDRDNSDREDRDSNSPAYQNSAYTDTDAPTSSAPSSAYYSDLSVTTMPERAYEVVGLSTMPSWDPGANSADVRRPTVRLAAISENVSTIPSDYV